MSTVLDVAIGVVFLYLLLALLVTTVQEFVASALRMRSTNLYDAIASMLKGTVTAPGNATGGGPARSDPEARKLVNEFFSHPLITNLTRSAEEATTAPAAGMGGQFRHWLEKRRQPSYIPSKTFALALVDVLRGTDAPAIGATSLLTEAQKSIGNLSDGELKRVLTIFLQQSESQVQDLEKEALRVRDGIENWFNDRMARASGWYKRKAQILSIALAAIVVVVFNADTIHVATSLWRDRALRDSVVASAQAYREAEQLPESADVKAHAAEVMARSEAIKNASFPIGWLWIGDALCARGAEPPSKAPGATSPAQAKCWDASTGDYALLACGWLITALAVSLGANFWFDILGKALQLRGSGPKVSPSTGEVETNKK